MKTKFVTHDIRCITKAAIGDKIIWDTLSSVIFFAFYRQYLVIYISFVPLLNVHGGNKKQVFIGWKIMGRGP